VDADDHGAGKLSVEITCVKGHVSVVKVYVSLFMKVLEAVGVCGVFERVFLFHAGRKKNGFICFSINIHFLVVKNKNYLK